MYWYTLNAGDRDLLGPLVRLYLKQLPVLQARPQQWWGHNGTSFAETSLFFGTYEPVDYDFKCIGRSGVPDATNPYTKHHYEGGIELAVMLLQAWQHNRSDVSFLQENVLPWCESMIQFYDEHYPKYPNGTMFLQYAQSCVVVDYSLFQKTSS